MENGAKMKMDPSLVVAIRAMATLTGRDVALRKHNSLLFLRISITAL